MSAVDRSLRWSVSADVALSEKSPHLGGVWVRWIFWPPRCSPRTSGNWGQVSKSGLASDELGVHAGVDASFSDEAFVGAAFDDAAVVEHQD